MRKFATAEDDDDLLPDDYPSDSDSYVLGKPTLDLAALMWQPSYRGGLLSADELSEPPESELESEPTNKGVESEPKSGSKFGSGFIPQDGSPSVLPSRFTTERYPVTAAFVEHGEEPRRGPVPLPRKSFTVGGTADSSDSIAGQTNQSVRPPPPLGCESLTSAQSTGPPTASAAVRPPPPAAPQSAAPRRDTSGAGTRPPPPPPPRTGDIGDRAAQIPSTAPTNSIDPPFGNSNAHSVTPTPPAAEPVPPPPFVQPQSSKIASSYADEGSETGEAEPQDTFGEPTALNNKHVPAPRRRMTGRPLPSAPGVDTEPELSPSKSHRPTPIHADGQGGEYKPQKRTGESTETHDGGSGPSSPLNAADQARKLVPIHALLPHELVEVSQHEKYGKYFKLLKVGIPKASVQKKMRDEGVNEIFLDLRPQDLVPIEETTNDFIAAREHPIYKKYFRMLKVGMQVPEVKVRLREDGIDPEIIELDPEQLVPLSEVRKYSGTGHSPSTAAGGVAATARKKRQLFQGIDASKLGEDSLWAEDEEEDIDFDAAELQRLFVAGTAHGAGPGAGAGGGARGPKTASLIDAKRAQNAAISLARIKFTYEQLHEKVLSLDDEKLSVEQLLSLREYLPTHGEAQALRAHKGDTAAWGPAERYMHAMLDLSQAASRIGCMIYKQQFPSLVHSCKAQLAQLEMACEDVKNCARLKKVLKTILKVGNQMDGGASHAGLSMESLLKLQSTKAFDKKTSVLQYVVCVIAKQDPDSLLFVEDVASSSIAAKLSFEQIANDKASIRRELEQQLQFLRTLDSSGEGSSLHSIIAKSLEFLSVKATHQCEDLDKRYGKTHAKFAHLLAYFGEEATLSSVDFFTMLSRFVQDFVTVRESVQKSMRVEERKQAAQELKDVSKRQSTGRVATAALFSQLSNESSEAAAEELVTGPVRRPSSMRISSSGAAQRRSQLLNEANAALTSTEEPQPATRRGSELELRRTNGIPKGRSSTNESTIAAIQAMVALQMSGPSSGDADGAHTETTVAASGLRSESDTSTTVEAAQPPRPPPPPAASTGSAPRPPPPSWSSCNPASAASPPPPPPPPSSVTAPLPPPTTIPAPPAAPQPPPAPPAGPTKPPPPPPPLK
jgi:hypothetical protein